MGAALTIRTARATDADAIAHILREAFREFEALYTPTAFAATTPDPAGVLERLSEGPAWLATLDDEPVGAAAAIHRATGLYIRGMAVLPRARGRGVGGALLESIERYAIDAGLRRLILSTTPFLSAAIRLYERSGFRRTSAGPPDLHGTPLITMVKELEGRSPAG